MVIGTGLLRVILKGTRIKNSQLRNFTSMYNGRYPPIPKNARIIDLRSDTLSQPSLEMRKEMFEAEVGDDVYGEDPTINELETKSASLLGKESALFVPSGTMGNLIAIMVHCDKRGAEIIVGSQSHIVLFEQAGAAQVGGVNIREVTNNSDGTFDIEELEKKIRIKDIHEPRTSLICVENTHNICGGKVLSLQWLDQLAHFAKRRQIPLHMDGARVFNAAIHQNVPVSRIVNNFDSISLCLSKSLGAPVGAMLVGSVSFIERARSIRKVLGGGCRQIGIVGAAGLYALDNMVLRLKNDHERTQKIASAIREMKSPNITVEDAEDIHSNILMINLNLDRLNADEFATRLRTATEDECLNMNERNPIIVKISCIRKQTSRIVLYCNISEDDVNAAIRKIRYVINEYDDAILSNRKEMYQTIENSGISEYN